MNLLQKTNFQERKTNSSLPVVYPNAGAGLDITYKSQTMPSPRAGTVTQDVATTVKEYKAGKVEFRVDAGGNVHCVIGKISFEQQQLVDNAEALIEHIRALKPASAKGTYMRHVVISATVSPSISVAV